MYIVYAVQIHILDCDCVFNSNIRLQFSHGITAAANSYAVHTHTQKTRMLVQSGSDFRHEMDEIEFSHSIGK